MENRAAVRCSLRREEWPLRSADTCAECRDFAGPDDKGALRASDGGEAQEAPGLGSERNLDAPEVACDWGGRSVYP
jgi:hypothetical protein